MNFTNCSTNTFTDIHFTFPTPQTICASSFFSFLFISIAVFLLRLAIIIRQAYLFFSSGNNKRKYILSLAHSSLILILLLTSFSLSVTDVQNIYNGWSYLILYMVFIVSLSRVIHPFHRVFTMGLQVYKMKRNIQASHSDSSTIWKIIVILSFIYFTVTLGLVLKLYYNLEHYQLYVISICLFTGCFLVIIFATNVFYLTICYRFLINSINSLADEEEKAERMNILNRLQYFQVAGIVFTLYGVYWLLLGTLVVPWSWYSIYAVAMIADNLFAAFIVFRFRSNRYTKGIRKDRNLERIPISSLYIVDINRMDSWETSLNDLNKRKTKSKVTIREMEIRKDAMIYFMFKRDIAESISKITETPVILFTILIFHLIVVALNAFYFVEPQGFISFDVVIVLSAIAAVSIMLLLFSRASTSILLQLMKTNTIHLRLLLIIILGLTSCDVVAFDERTMIVVLTCIMLFTAYVSHDILIENSTWVRNTLFTSGLVVSFLSATLLQLDLLTRRRTTNVDWLNIDGLIYNWSTYQTALESSYSITLLFIKQAIQISRTSSEHFLLLNDPIHVKVIPFSSLSRQRSNLSTTNHHLPDEASTTKTLPQVTHQNMENSSIVSPIEADGIPSIDIRKGN